MMARILLKLVVVFSVLCVSLDTAAQSDVALATRKAKLTALSERLKTRDEVDRRHAREFARRAGIPFRRELPNGKVLELQRIAPDIGPVFYITNNVDAADTVSTDEVYTGRSAGLNLDGGGMTVGEWDGGAVAEHPDFDSRLTQVDSPPAMSNHSTHVAGTLIGSGLSLIPDSRGMAYAAHLNAYDWNSDTAEMALAAANGLLISNHSYGIAAGWLYLGGAPPDTWWWIGGADPGDVEDPNFGYYDSESQLWDQIAVDAPYYLIVKAAGNDRSDIGPAPGELYTVIDQDGNFLFTSTISRQPDCWPAGYDCMPTHSGAKNILTVGAVDDLIGGYSTFSGASSVQMAEFSDWGPTDDGRIKPDVVGNGIFLMSTWGENPFFAAAAGTSMATPNVTGSLLLLQEHHQDLNGPGNFMRAATLKALAIHTADEAGDSDGPDYEFGWGLLNTKTAAQVITDNGGAHQIVEGTLANGGVNTVDITVSNADDTVMATLVWADPAGTPVAPTMDPPDSMLVNDLDLRIEKNPATYMPWVLNPAAPADAATTGDNFRDNVEQVVVNGGGTGTYTIEVSHKGTLLDNNSQAYSLIISVTPPPPVGSFMLVDEDFSGGLPAGWSIDTTMGTDWTINSPVAGDPRLNNLTGGSGNFAMVDVDFSNYAMTSLRMPAFDLSTAVAVILRFRSAFYFDLYESINVDISTDGGTGWNNVWTWQGFNPFPTQYALDLSGVAGGQGSVTLRFRFNSVAEILGNLWQVDNVELEVFGGGPPPGDPPGQATSPNPANGASGPGLSITLSWAAGTAATSHDVYFGTSSTPASQGNQTGTSYDPGTLAYSTPYYWRIDEVNDDGTTTGTNWSFTTMAAPPAAVHLSNLSGFAEAASRGRWNAFVQFTVVGAGGSPVAEIIVDGAWSNGANGGGSCTTDDSGQCNVQKNNLKGNTSPVTFTVTGMSGTGFTYEPGENEVPDSIAVSKDDVNQLPSAVNDSYQTDVDVAVNDNVIANDTQGDGTASINSNTLPSNGNLNLANDGVFTYTPNAAWEGIDSFTYSIVDTDGDISNTATVSITVSGTEPPPGDPPGQASGPNPANGSSGVALNPSLSWSAGSLATSHDVYFGTSPTTPASQGNQTGTSYDPGTLAYSTTYYWRIDEVNADGTTTGAGWSFTTEAQPAGQRSVSLRPYKQKGVQHVEVTWENFSGATVEIYRGGSQVDGSPTGNDGSHVDNIDVKGGGQTYTYNVCETGQTNCLSATTGF